MRRTPRSRRARPNLFLLEDRTAPATLTWTGDVNANWSTNVAGNTNWNTNLLPASGDDLIFPASGANHVNTNDLTGLSPNSIIFSGTDYVIGGNSVTILAGLTDGSTFGDNALNLPITVTGTINANISVVFTSLTLGGVISGVGGVAKIGPGRLRLGGSAANTYTGLTRVSAGTLELAKAGAAAVAGDLLVSAGTAREVFNNELANTSDVTVNSGGTFDLNDFSDTIATLTVGGGSVTIGTGTLSPTGAVTMTGGSIASTGAGKFVLQGILTCNATSTAASISGNLDLGGATRAFHINDGTAAIDLDISAVISNGGLAKTNPGTLRLDGAQANTYTGQTSVNGGTLELAKTGGVTAISDNLDIALGIVRQIVGNQFVGNTSIVVENGTTLDLNGLSAAVGVVSVFPNALLTTGGVGVGHLTAGIISTDTGSTLAMNLAGMANSDQLTINGSVSIRGALNLNPTQAIAVGTAITLIDNDGIDPVTGTFAGLPQGAAFLLGGQAFAISYIGGTGNDVVVTRISGGIVMSTRVNDGSAQRSRVTSLTVTFGAQATFVGTVTSAFTLTHIGGAAVTFAATANVINGVTVVTINNFTGSETEFGSLKDGRYTLTALASQITFGGIQLDGNGDGMPGDNYTFGEAQGLFRFFGDINGDRHVDVADFGLFSSTFNLSTGQTGFLAAFDFNGDGHIDIFDFGQFSLRFFTPLP